MRLEWLKLTSSEEGLCRAGIPASEEGVLPQLVLGPLSLEEGPQSLGVRPLWVGQGDEAGFASVGKR